MTNRIDSKQYVTTLLWICGENLDMDLINQRLEAKEPSLVKNPTTLCKGEWSINNTMLRTINEEKS